MRFFRMLREHLHISAKTVIYGEMLVLSLLCLSIFLFKTDPGQAVISQASRLAGYMNPLENTDSADPDNYWPIWVPVTAETFPNISRNT